MYKWHFDKLYVELLKTHLSANPRICKLRTQISKVPWRYVYRQNDHVTLRPKRSSPMDRHLAPPISGSWSAGAARAVDGASLLHGPLRVDRNAETEKKVNGWTERPGTDFKCTHVRCPRARFAGCSYQTRIHFAGFTVQGILRRVEIMLIRSLLPCWSTEVRQFFILKFKGTLSRLKEGNHFLLLKWNQLTLSGQSNSTAVFHDSV